MRRKLTISFLGIIVFLLFVFFSYLVHKDIFTQFDFNITVKLQDNISRRFDELFSSFSLIGSVEFVSLFLIALLIIRRRLIGIFILFFYASIHLFELYGKIFVSHPGPPFMFFRNNIDISFPSSYIKTGFSYPSGHSARTAFISMVIFLMVLRSKRLSNTHKMIILLGLAIFDITMFVSRIYLGEHWATDVIGGAFLGASLGLLTAFAL
ncbi:MAG: phosphatase PAP2 family protein [Candidatus Levybacteria bacterium]|nr:phosphatase PAP2 family protein [Candidatus Levybacteria bacterium]